MSILQPLLHRFNSALLGVDVVEPNLRQPLREILKRLVVLQQHYAEFREPVLHTFNIMRDAEHMSLGALTSQLRHAPVRRIFQAFLENVATDAMTDEHKLLAGYLLEQMPVSALAPAPLRPAAVAAASISSSTPEYFPIKNRDEAYIEKSLWPDRPGYIHIDRTIALLCSPVLGRGGFGLVRMALNPATGEILAAKQLRRIGGYDWGTAITPDADATKERTILAAIHGPNFSRPLLPTTDAVFLQMPWMPADLADFFRKLDFAAIPFRSAYARGVAFRALAPQLAAQLHQFHTRFPQAVALDIKPDNVLLSDVAGGQVKLVDFGLVAETDPQTRRIAGIPGGTPGYRAPEAHHQGATDQRADVWSLGLVFAQLLASPLQAPFPATADAANEYTRLTQYATWHAAHTQAIQNNTMPPRATTPPDHCFSRFFFALAVAGPHHCGALINHILHPDSEVRFNSAQLSAWANNLSRTPADDSALAHILGKYFLQSNRSELAERNLRELSQSFQGPAGRGP